jgi:hypothetical protein
LGLNKEQIEEAEEKHGKNELPAEEGKSLWELIGSYHMSLLICLNKNQFIGDFETILRHFEKFFLETL